MAERLHELKDLRKLMKGHQTDEKSEDVAKDIADLDRAVQELRNFSSTHGIKARKRPGFENVITKTLSTSGEADSLVTAAVSAYSAVAHAVPDIVLTYTVDRSREDWDPFEIGAREISFNLVLDMVVTVLVAYTRAVRLQIDAYGWAPDAWKTWLDHVRGRLLETLAVHQNAKESDSDEQDAAAANGTTSADEPEVEWSIPIHPFMKAVLEERRRDFITKFGKPPCR
jgi:hypothetical protein